MAWKLKNRLFLEMCEQQQNVLKNVMCKASNYSHAGNFLAWQLTVNYLNGLKQSCTSMLLRQQNLGNLLNCFAYVCSTVEQCKAWFEVLRSRIRNKNANAHVLHEIMLNVSRPSTRNKYLNSFGVFISLLLVNQKWSCFAQTSLFFLAATTFLKICIKIFCK